jgi:quinol monooxygenase YgiN
MPFTQMMAVQTSQPDRLRQLMDDWHSEQLGVAPGYERARVLADRQASDRWLIEVDFASVEDAERNNDRPETQAWARKLRDLADGEPEYHDFELAFATA